MNFPFREVTDNPVGEFSKAQRNLLSLLISLFSNVIFSVTSITVLINLIGLFSSSYNTSAFEIINFIGYLLLFCT